MKNNNCKQLGVFCAMAVFLFFGFWIHLSSCVFDARGISGGTDGICGNGILESGEECDGLDFGGRTCESLGLGQGTLVCTNDCRIDSSGCVSGICGDGTADHGEDCDGDDLRGNNCESLGYAGGILACDGECRFDTSMCEVLETCGNGELDPGEECDDGEENSDTTPNACRTNCRLPRCGDGILDDGFDEECDDGASNSDTIPNACRTNCMLPVCGDGILDYEYDEECDDGSSNSDTIPNACRTNCSLPVCGDGILDDQFDEECDDGSSNSDTTPNACRTDCSLPVCGDGILDDQFGEECDGSVPPGVSCQSLGLGDGNVQCMEDCRLDTSQCSTGGVTGDPCQSNDDCGSNNCWNETWGGWPKGYCSQACNPLDIAGCGDGSVCLIVSGIGHRCFASCQETTHCRPGYSCFPTQTSDSICFPNCDDNGQCNGGNCERYTGMCGGSALGGQNGAACVNHDDCRGYCVAQDPDTGNPPHGYCMSPCSLSKDNCPAGNVCVDFSLGADLGGCMAQCSNNGHCRTSQGYACDWPSWDPGAGGRVCWMF